MVSDDGQRFVERKLTMTVLSYPLCLQLDASIALEMLQFVEVFAQQPVVITNADGLPLESTQISEVWRRWWKQTSDAKALADGAVVHWLLGNTDRHAFFVSRYYAVDQVLRELDRHAQCLLDRFRRPDMPLYEWAIMGPKGTRVRAHVDMFGTASWNLLLCGQKTWQFWPPVANPNQSPPVFICNQGEGQLIWIPEDWWHAVDYHTSALCLSKNLVLVRSLPSIAEAVAGKAPSLEPYLSALMAIRSQIDASVV